MILLGDLYVRNDLILCINTEVDLELSIRLDPRISSRDITLKYKTEQEKKDALSKILLEINNPNINSAESNKIINLEKELTKYNKVYEHDLDRILKSSQEALNELKSELVPEINYLKRQNITLHNTLNQLSYKGIELEDIKVLNLSGGITNALKRSHILLVGDLLQLTETDLIKIRSISDKSLNVIKTALEDKHLKLKEEMKNEC